MQQPAASQRPLLPSRRQVIVAVLATAAVPLLAQDAERRVQVAVDPPQKHSFTDTITEYESVLYAVQMRVGDTLRVELASSNAANCFDIHAPGTAKPVYVGADSGNTHDYVARTEGEHVVRVYLLRFAARDGQSAQFTLELEPAGGSHGNTVVYRDAAALPATGNGAGPSHLPP